MIATKQNQKDGFSFPNCLKKDQITKIVIYINLPIEKVAW